MTNIVRIDPSRERSNARIQLVGRGYRLARRCGWRLHKCARTFDPYAAGPYELLLYDGRSLWGPITLDAAVRCCERTLWLEDR
jgi:hypothetical protein